MSDQTSKVTIHMVASLDGFVAKKDNSISWMQSEEHFEDGEILTDTDVSNFLESVDCYVMGSGTFEHTRQLGWPYGNTPVFVLTGKPLKTNRKSVTFVSGNLDQIVESQLKRKYKNIWMVGGSLLTKKFIQQGLADDIVITIVPIILGAGKPFFDQIGQEHALHLKDVKAFRDGMVELWYEILKE